MFKIFMLIVLLDPNHNYKDHRQIEFKNLDECQQAMPEQTDEPLPGGSWLIRRCVIQRGA